MLRAAPHCFESLEHTKGIGIPSMKRIKILFNFSSGYLAQHSEQPVLLVNGRSILGIASYGFTGYNFFGNFYAAVFAVAVVSDYHLLLNP